jgi:hypothetical protein
LVRNRSCSDVTGTGELFDWAIASHVIEHVPNMPVEFQKFRGLAQY